MCISEGLSSQPISEPTLCVGNVWSHRDEWEVLSRLSLSALRVLYSNVNGDIRHGVRRGLGGALESSVCVCVCMCV